MVTIITVVFGVAQIVLREGGLDGGNEGKLTQFI